MLGSRRTEWESPPPRPCGACCTPAALFQRQPRLPVALGKRDGQPLRPACDASASSGCQPCGASGLSSVLPTGPLATLPTAPRHLLPSGRPKTRRCELSCLALVWPHPPDPPGFLLGSRQTLLETFDGGKTWAPRTVQAAQVGAAQAGFDPFDCGLAALFNFGPGSAARHACLCCAARPAPCLLARLGRVAGPGSLAACRRQRQRQRLGCTSQDFRRQQSGWRLGPGVAGVKGPDTSPQ